MLKASLIFLTFNQEKYVEAALLSALAQDYPNFEVIIADDGSSDRTLAIIEGVLSGHSSWRLARFLPPEPNMGLIKNWNRAMLSATGDIIVVMAGDDISEITRTTKLVKIFEDNPVVMAAFSQVSIIDEAGNILQDNFEKNRPQYSLHFRSEASSGFDFWAGAPILGACGAYRKQLSDKFGPIIYAHSEDEPSIYRALLLGSVAYSGENLVRWRWHGLNLSTGSLIDETSPIAVLNKRAEMCARRMDACRQHAMDLQLASQQGWLTEKVSLSETKKLRSLKAIHELGYHTLNQNSTLWAWIKAAFQLLRYDYSSGAAWGYGLRSALKRVSPIGIKIKYSRPTR
jgi:glycosyltransferase involved in cell wall biosynthesis